MFTISFLDRKEVFIAWLVSTSIIFFRYLLFAGASYFIFYIWQRNKLLHLKIQKFFPAKAIVLSEVSHSVVSTVVFGIFMLLILYLKSIGLTRIYNDLDEYGYGYLLFSFIFLVCFHDTYFYWTHRLMHHRKLFRLVHQVHHQSRNPTPWASFSFHPLEAIIEFAFLPIAVFCIPFHPLAIAAWSFWMIAWNVMGHLGFELFPKNAIYHPVWKWFNTSTHHNLHHQRSQGNFGLYFNFWDRWMNTNDKAYEEVFLKGRRS